MGEIPAKRIIAPALGERTRSTMVLRFNGACVRQTWILVSGEEIVAGGEGAAVDWADSGGSEAMAVVVLFGGSDVLMSRWAGSGGGGWGIT